MALPARLYGLEALSVSAEHCTATGMTQHIQMQLAPAAGDAGDAVDAGADFFAHVDVTKP